MPATTKHAALKWISARHLQHFIANAEKAGVDIDLLLEDAGVVRARLSDPDYPVPVAAVELMLSTITREYAEPLVGLRLARDIQPATFGPLGYIAQACTTFADVLEVVTRYSGLLSNIGKSSVVHAPDATEVRWECTAGGRIFRRQATEYVLGSFVTLARLLMPERQDMPRAVTFTHPGPDSPRHARGYVSFFKCPVYFGRPASAVVIPALALKARLRHGDAFIKSLLERHAATMLKQRTTDSSLGDEVSHLVKAMILDGVPTKDMVAAQLGMSGRSLHRKLEDAGTSYREILDRVRLEIASERLKFAADSTTEISGSLGFSTRQAFLRWFKQRTGETPGEFRTKNQRSDADD
jgi:AraC-like DNA-binding protein